MEYKSQNMVCQNCKGNFTIEPEDFGFYEKIKVPPPTFCPECRAMRRLVWRNERALYHNICAFSGKKVVSMFSPDSGFTIYDRDIWWSDKWDPTAYGKDYDFSKPFFQQWQELLHRIPLPNLGNTNVVNSDYVNHTADMKNCYLTYGSMVAENVSYSDGIYKVKDSLDLYIVMSSEKCYDDAFCNNIYQTHFSYDSDDSINSHFLTSCINVQDSLGCVNLRHKSHCIFNKEYQKEEYEKKRSKYDFGSYRSLESFKQKFKKFLLKQPRRFASILKSNNTTGDMIMNAKNCQYVFDVYDELEDCKYCVHTFGLKNGYDGYGIGDHSELLYEGVDFGHHGMRNYFGVLNHGSLDNQYIYMCYSSKNIFGCVGIRNSEYVILNKKYTKEEYNKLLPKIIKHMNEMPFIDALGREYRYGEFFPIGFSPFAYNETIAGEYYPLKKEEAVKYGFTWKANEKREYISDFKAEDLPDHIKDADESLVGKVIECVHKGECNQQCTEAFKIREDELQFYKKNNVALPRLCPNCRHFERLARRNPLKLWHRQCMCEKSHPHHKSRCEAEFETSYAPERPEVIYCEKCYQQEVY
ncbi:hypothetical protein A3G53_01285 [Candidatus Nomurabacteria bacterium RIFCSPLOWO2_12_FULL_44_11]|uniref:Zinc-binding domain-containing protein n=1 Tax=Candidatus Nomurabacteria bacterium RIFCSPLOWO2_12_FULL_44_11 TaxID=1801796 RepID=A0A1F6Y7H7_9BACT|nr:MAG: hypothetical protein A3E95_02095 [Candidatus Nomurabacteria bacterium RIFCSPHIGHO2_12_FULL_44_22b]OGJ02289.1 MAG: hypothetical protein A3G53_01285 [Candidatus Nomurabacteria bacterium RIFCSPLOWO2_12_FULL_44_11]